MYELNYGKLLDARAVASALGVSVQTVRRSSLAGILPQPIRVGRRALRWRLSDLMPLLGEDPYVERSETFDE
jgi:predicted DNA-binding transcriptional regulator AlpA